jgi:hypothetical protein
VHATLAARDKIDSDDYIQIVLDPFNDRRRASSSGQPVRRAGRRRAGGFNRRSRAGRRRQAGPTSTSPRLLFE